MCSRRFNPVLLVLDGTPSPRLDELTLAFENAGGKAYIGEDAWSHMAYKSGVLMSVFSDRYIHKPLLGLSLNAGFEMGDLKMSWSESTLTISSDGEEYIIPREA